MLATHCNAKQREYVLMAEIFPRHYFLAESLLNRIQYVGMHYSEV